MKNLLTRSLTGILFVAVITAAVLCGTYSFLIIFGLIAILGYLEFLQLTRFQREKIRALVVIDIIGACALFLSVLSFPVALPNKLFIIAFLTYFVYFIIRPIALLYYKKSGETLVADWAYAILGHIYVVFPLALLGTWGYRLPGMEHPEYLLMALFVFIWTNDTGAFLVGCTFGKHRLFERISPKKSWEGFFGGLAFCTILGACANLIIPGILTPAQWIGMGVLTSIFSTWGDLCESLLKRTAGVKDSGNLLPGHGGILDRFDSELLASPVIFLYILLITFL